jgi:hypothetical protein
MLTDEPIDSLANTRSPFRYISNTSIGCATYPNERFQTTPHILAGWGSDTITDTWRDTTTRY